MSTRQKRSKILSNAEVLEPRISPMDWFNGIRRSSVFIPMGNPSSEINGWIDAFPFGTTASANEMLGSVGGGSAVIGNLQLTTFSNGDLLFGTTINLPPPPPLSGPGQ